jgi:hypothetical protein
MDGQRVRTVRKFPSPQPTSPSLKVGLGLLHHLRFHWQQFQTWEHKASTRNAVCCLEISVISWRRAGNTIAFLMSNTKAATGVRHSAVSPVFVGSLQLLRRITFFAHTHTYAWCSLAFTIHNKCISVIHVCSLINLRSYNWLISCDWRHNCSSALSILSSLLQRQSNTHTRLVASLQITISTMLPHYVS